MLGDSQSRRKFNVGKIKLQKSTMNESTTQNHLKKRETQLLEKYRTISRMQNHQSTFQPSKAKLGQSYLYVGILSERKNEEQGHKLSEDLNPFAFDIGNNPKTMTKNAHTGKAYWERQMNKEVKQFKQKVDTVNEGIENQLKDLENKINDLKWKRKNNSARKSQIHIQLPRQDSEPQPIFYQHHILQQSHPIHTVQDQVTEERQILKKIEEDQQVIERMKIIQDKIQRSREHAEMGRQSFIQSVDAKICKTDYEQLPIRTQQAENMSKSNVKLMGELTFSTEFTTLVNRLTRQIELDFEFTKLIGFLSQKKPAMMESVRNQLMQIVPGHNESFLTIVPAEMDPLNMEYPAIIGVDEVLVMKRFQKIELHYGAKLLNQFSVQTVNFLYEELTQRCNNGITLTAGHFVSYISMRTGRDFRNRAIIKLLKRMNAYAYSDGSIDFALVKDSLVKK